MGMKKYLVGAALAAVITTPLQAQDADNADSFAKGGDRQEQTVAAKSGIPVQRIHPRDQRVEDALEKLASFDYFETRLEDVLAEIASDYRIPVVLDEAIQENNLDEETLITCKLENISLAAALRLMLGPYHAAPMIKDEVLVITKRETEAKHLYVKIYDCRKMLMAIDSDDAVNEKLMTVLRNTVCPGSWNDQGGPASVAELGGRLIVNQTNDAHRQIAAILNSLNLDEKEVRSEAFSTDQSPAAASR